MEISFLYGNFNTEYMSLNKQCDYMEKILKSSNMMILFIKLVELMIDFEIFYLDIFVRTQLFFIIV